MKLRSPLLKLLAMSSISLYGHGCALGTEVGNGAKPEKDGDQSKSSKQAPIPAAPKSTDNAYGDSLVGIFGGPEINGQENWKAIGDGVSAYPAGVGSVAGMGQAGSSGVSAGAVGDGISGKSAISDTRPLAPIVESKALNKANLDPTIIDLALTGCQSPLYKQNPAGSATFAVVNAALSQKTSITISAAAEPDTWSITSEDKALARFVKWSPQVVVTKPVADGTLVAVPSYGRCTPVAVAAPAVLAGFNDKFTKTTYLITTSRGNTYLTWYVMDGTGDFISRLKRIELDKAQSSPNPAVVMSAP